MTELGNDGGWVDVPVIVGPLSPDQLTLLRQAQAVAVIWHACANDSLTSRGQAALFDMDQELDAADKADRALTAATDGQPVALTDSSSRLLTVGLSFLVAPLLKRPDSVMFARIQPLYGPTLDALETARITAGLEP